jgi:predicted metal-dependent HD superfamily phosphohydrolase
MVVPAMPTAAADDDLVLLKDTWAAVCAETGVVRHDLAFQLIASAYADPARHYHNTRHIADCLREFQPVRALCERPLAVAAALLFHDYVYAPTRHDNEERSADEAAMALAALRWPPLTIDAVRSMILATRHAHPPDSADAAIVVDIDLAILGKPADEFDAYERAIRQEYAHVPAAEFRTGRAAVLRNFLARPRIYATDHFAARYEMRARQNLGQSIASLEG